MNEVISRKGKSFDHDYLPWTAPPQSAVYTHPDEVLSDSSLTFDQKREVLASWASDARAVVDAPTLRQLDSGAVVHIDAVLWALSRLSCGRAANV
jgi:hypothetical protein